MLRKATRQKAKIRIGLSSPSGAGKTYSAILLAKGIASSESKIALIDTENGSGDLYSHLGEYNVLTLQAPFSPEAYIKAIKECEDAGMEVIIVDSVTHEWEGKGGCLEINEVLAKAKYKGNTWSAWSETTPRHQKFIEAIVSSKAHIITTVRNKVETMMTEDKKVKKVGVKEVQREGFEYELTVNFNLDQETHLANVSKDRTELFVKRDPFMITVETGKEIKEWAETGEEAKAPATTPNAPKTEAPKEEIPLLADATPEEVIKFYPKVAVMIKGSNSIKTPLEIIKYAIKVEGSKIYSDEEKAKVYTHLKSKIVEITPDFESYLSFINLPEIFELPNTGIADELFNVLHAKYNDGKTAPKN